MKWTRNNNDNNQYPRLFPSLLTSTHEHHFSFFLATLKRTPPSSHTPAHTHEVNGNEVDSAPSEVTRGPRIKIGSWRVCEGGRVLSFSLGQLRLTQLPLTPRNDRNWVGSFFAGDEGKRRVLS